MDEWRLQLFIALGVTLTPGVILAVAYLVAIVVPAFRQPARTGAELNRRVRFEAWSGMVLALPALAFGLSGGPDAAWNWACGVLLALTLGVYSVSIAALVGRVVPAPLLALPAILAFLVPPMTATALGATHVIGAVGWSMLDQLFAGAIASLGYFVFVSYFGVGYFAWCVASVRFARAVGRRDRQNTAHRWVVGDSRALSRDSKAPEVVPL